MALADLEMAGHDVVGTAILKLVGQRFFGLLCLDQASQPPPQLVCVFLKFTEIAVTSSIIRSYSHEIHPVPLP